MATKTSRCAYMSALADAPSVRQRIVIVLRDKMPMSCEGLQRELGRPHQTISARLSELYRDGIISDSGATRLTRYGKGAIVWEITA